MRPTPLASWLAATLLAACALERHGLGPGPTIDASLDATADGAADACVPSLERCNERDDDCDGRVDEDFDVSSDPQHCGGCNRACVGGANATALCVDGTCVLRCESGYLDCDERAGCESDATSPASCGSCTVMCAAPTPLCDPGSGSDARCVADCPAGTTRCGATCVATDSSPVHCGACDNRCPDPAGARPVCASGTCGIECLPGRENCNGNDADGCEVDLASLAHCGACGRACMPPNATGRCHEGRCEIEACNAGYTNCNGSVADGCEARVGVDPAHCGGCGMACAAGERCEGGRCRRPAELVEIDGGLGFTCARISDGRVYCWGDGSMGQLGTGVTAPATSAQPVMDFVADTDSGAVSLSTGHLHACAVRRDGAIRCWGAGNRGQLGNGDTANQSLPVAVVDITDARAVAAGGEFTCALLRSGAVRCWGRNNHGQLGTANSDADRPEPPIAGLSDVVQISAGNTHACARLATGEVRCWGQNNSGQLGNGSTGGSSSIPVRVVGLDDAVDVACGSGFSCAVRATGAVLCWGRNQHGQLGNGSTSMMGISTPVAVSRLSTATVVDAGGSHGCALDTTGQAWCWGFNDKGQLGDGTTTSSSVPVNVGGALVPSVAMSGLGLGSSHSCGLLGAMAPRCWGGNGFGQLGDGTRINRSTPVVVTGLP